MTLAMWTLAVLGWALPPSCPSGLDRELPPLAGSRVSAQDPGFDHTHATWTRVLERHVQGDRFDYEALSLQRGPLDEYLLQLRGVQADDYANWSREQRYAFWINAHNAFTVHLVLSRYPVESIKDIGTTSAPVWEQEFIPLGHLIGRPEADKISLDTIERAILRLQFEDARVHAALQRASQGGPLLRAEAYQAERLERQLDAQARSWLADPRYNRFERDQGRVRISEIFDWFEDDFVRDAGSIQAWLARHAPQDEAAWVGQAEELEIDHLPYSWKLDDLERQER